MKMEMIAAMNRNMSTGSRGAFGAQSKLPESLSLSPTLRMCLGRHLSSLFPFSVGSLLPPALCLPLRSRRVEIARLRQRQLVNLAAQLWPQSPHLAALALAPSRRTGARELSGQMSVFVGAHRAHWLAGWLAGWLAVGERARGRRQGRGGASLAPLCMCVCLCVRGGRQLRAGGRETRERRRAAHTHTHTLS